MHTYEVVKKNGSLYLKCTYIGSNFQDEDYMKIYSVSNNPYVRRLGTKIHLTAEMIEMMNKVA